MREARRRCRRGASGRSPSPRAPPRPRPRRARPRSPRPGRGRRAASLGLGRQDLLGEVERHARDRRRVVLPDALLEPLAELRVLVAGASRTARAAAAAAGSRQRLDARRRAAVPRGRRARRRSRPCAGSRCRRAGRPARGRPAAGPPRSRTSARAGRPRARRSRPPSTSTGSSEAAISARPSTGSVAKPSGAGGSPGSSGSRRAARTARAPPDASAPSRANVVAVEPQRLDAAARAHGGGAGRVGEQAHLAEAVAAAEQVERHLLAVLGPLEDAGRPGDDDVERVGRIALADDHLAEVVGDGLERLADDTPHVLRHGPERGQLVEDAKALLGRRQLRETQARSPAR